LCWIGAPGQHRRFEGQGKTEPTTLAFLARGIVACRERGFQRPPAGRMRNEFAALAPNGMAIHGHVQSPQFVQELSHSAANAFSLLEYCE
jgi:hypothetical protein